MPGFGGVDGSEDVAVVAVVLGDSVWVSVDACEFGRGMNSHYGMDVGGDDIQEFVVR